MANSYSNPYNLSEDDENQIQNVEVQDPGLPRGAVIDIQLGKNDPWSNPYDLPADVDRELRRTVAYDEGAHRGTTYSAQGDDELSGADPFKSFGSKAARVIWSDVMAQPAYNRREYLRQILVKLSPDLWTTVEQAATREQAVGKSAQAALRVGLERALSQQMVKDLMSSGWKQTAVGLAGLGACCDSCSGREGLGWGISSITGGVSSGLSIAGSAASGIASAAKAVAELACDAVNSPLARPAANYGGYAQGGTAGSVGAVKGLETAQKACSAGAKVASVLKPAQPTQNVMTAKTAKKTIGIMNKAAAPVAVKSKFPVVPALIGAGVLAFFFLRNK